MAEPTAQGQILGYVIAGACVSGAVSVWRSDAYLPVPTTGWLKFACDVS